jgi:hypothetical protein
MFAMDKDPANGRAARLGAIVAVVTLALTASLMLFSSGASAAARTGSSKLAPGLKLVSAPKKCPRGDKRAALATGQTGAAGHSFGRTHGVRSILLCNYNGMKNPPPINDPKAKAWGLVGHDNVTDAATVSSLADGIADTRIAPSGTYSCPMDTLNDVIAYVRIGHRRAYRYAIDTGGCNTVVSGKVARMALDAPYISQMLTLAPRATFSAGPNL